MFCYIVLIEWILEAASLKNLQECQSSITPDGIIYPTRVLQGSTSALAYLHYLLTSLVSANP